MNYQTYLEEFERIIKNEAQEPPYTDPNYLTYVKLNYSRMNRWWKGLQLNEELTTVLQGIKEQQQWIIIAEPWCGDAAPSLPFLVKLAEQNPLIRYDIQLRDQKPFLINDYLTNGGKSIPKLIVRNKNGNDLFTWGPRPASAQALVTRLKAADADFETLSTELQNWYNKDKGAELQTELLQLLKSTTI